MSQQAARITVCMPVYNAMPHLADTLRSLLEQSFRGFDLLIINDGSTDGSAAYLDAFVAQQLHPNTKVIHQSNRGLTATLNRMLEELGSGWLVRQDADDICLPNRLHRLREWIDRYPEAGMIYSQASHYQQGHLRGQLRTTPSDSSGLRSFLQKGFLPSICHPSIALRVEAAQELGGYRFDLHVEDYDLYWRMGLHYDVHMIPEVLLGYRMSSSSISDRNSEIQATNILYVQYLLLSSLWQTTSRAYAEVQPVLESMVDRGQLGFRRQIRSAMVRYGQGQYIGFAAHLMKAFLASPMSFLARFRPQQSKLAKVGVSPSLFQARRTELWPNS